MAPMPMIINFSDLQTNQWSFCLFQTITNQIYGNTTYVNNNTHGLDQSHEPTRSSDIK